MFKKEPKADKKQQYRSVCPGVTGAKRKATSDQQVDEYARQF